MNRKRFHEILNSNSDIIDTVNANNTNVVFAIKPVKPKTPNNLEETDRDEVDILYLPFDVPSASSEDIDYSEIYVGDFQETDIHMINPLLSDSTNNNKQ
jgi:hypothetical protein